MTTTVVGYNQSCCQASLAANIIKRIVELLGIKCDTQHYSRKQPTKFELYVQESGCDTVVWISPPAVDTASILKEFGVKQLGFIWEPWFEYSDSVPEMQLLLSPFKSTLIDTAKQLNVRNIRTVQWNFPVQRIVSRKNNVVRNAAASVFARTSLTDDELTSLSYISTINGVNLRLFTPHEPLAAKARSVGVESVITTDIVDHTFKLAANDVAILPFRSYQLCLDALLSARAGLAAIAYNIVPVNEVFIDKISAILVPCRVSGDIKGRQAVTSRFNLLSDLFEEAVRENLFANVQTTVNGMYDVNLVSLYDSWRSVFD